MPDTPLSPGKGARVLGFFVFQLGAGVILDSTAHALGTAIGACGLTMFGWGLLQLAGRERGREIAIGEGSASAEGNREC